MGALPLRCLMTMFLYSQSTQRPPILSSCSSCVQHAAPSVGLRQAGTPSPALDDRQPPHGARNRQLYTLEGELPLLSNR